MTVPTKNNSVQPLNWQRPIVTPNGTATDEFQRAWAQQARMNAAIPNLTNAAAVSALLDLISSTEGSLLERGSAAWGVIASPGDATKFLNGTTDPSWAHVTDADLSLSDITTNNVSTTKHGFAPKGTGTGTKYLDDTGAYSTPTSSSGGGAASIQDNGTTVYIALSDTNGQLVLDGSGDPIFAPEVFSASAIPKPTATTLGGVESIAVVAHEFLTGISTSGVPSAAQPATTDLSDIGTGTWTPADASGGGLTLSVTSATYTRVGAIYFVSLYVTYPATVDTNNTAISGFPGTRSLDVTGVNSNLASSVSAYITASGHIAFFDNATGANLTNANCSGKVFELMLIAGV
jgi:hypothetical protein